MRGAIRLHLNEMPYPPSADVIAAAQQGLAMLHRYADDSQLEALRRLLADHCGVCKRRVVLSPGSDILLREVIHTFSKGRKVITVSPSFLPTVQAAKQFAAEWLSIRLSPPAFDLNLDVLMHALAEPSLVIIDNPNNPTGRMLLDHRAVEAIVEHTETLLVVDEAYYEFSGVTCADMVVDHPSLMVTRTLDKAFSLAGARVGYAIAGDAFQDALASFYALLPQPSLCAAMEALRHPDYMRANVRRIVDERDRLWHALDRLGVQVYPSCTNFLLLRTEIHDLATRLRDVGVLVSDVSNQLPSGFLRVSMGTAQENDAFMGALGQHVRERSPASN